MNRTERARSQTHQGHSRGFSEAGRAIGGGRGGCLDLLARAGGGFGTLRGTRGAYEVRGVVSGTALAASRSARRAACRVSSLRRMRSRAALWAGEGEDEREPVAGGGSSIVPDDAPEESRSALRASSAGEGTGEVVGVERSVVDGTDDIGEEGGEVRWARGEWRKQQQTSRGASPLVNVASDLQPIE